MLGHDLGFYDQTLNYVPAHRNHKPYLTFNLEQAMGAKAVAFAFDRLERPVSDNIHGLYKQDLANLSFAQLCKLRWASYIMLHRSVEDIFEKDPHYHIIYKILSSAWRWGCGRPGWNETVDTYNGLRSFFLGLPDFEVRLDYTTFVNPQGFSVESRTFLDGVFGYLVYYKNVHVMTLGFSVMTGRRLLIQQMQMKKAKGNRFLYKFPNQKLEFIIRCFQKAFPRHRLYIIDGQDTANKYIEDYKHSQKSAKTRLETILEHVESEEKLYNRRCVQDAELNLKHLTDRLTHLKLDKPRLEHLYAQTGCFKRGKPLTVNKIRHYPLTKKERT